MDDKFDIFEILKQIWTAKLKLVKCGVIGLVSGVIIALSIPRTYVSSTVVSPESKAQQGTSGQMGALASMAGINLSDNSAGDGMATQLYPLIIGTTPFLMDLANVQVTVDAKQIPLSDYILNEQKQAWWSYIIKSPALVIGFFSKNDINQTIYTSEELKLKYLDALASRLSIEEDKKTKTLKISASMQSSEVSYVVVDSMFSKLKTYVAKYQTQKLRDNLENMIIMLEQAKQTYYNADEAYAIAADRNQNLVSKAAQIKLERLSNEKNLAFSVYEQLAAQVEMSRVKLLEQTPIATVLEPASVPLIPNAPNRKLIVIVFVFLGVFGAAMKVGIKSYLNNEKADI